MKRLCLSLVILAAWAGAADAQPGSGTYVSNPPAITSTTTTTLAAGYVKSSGTALSSQAVPIPVADGGSGVATLTGLALGNGAAAFSAYAGTSCTNQFPRSLSAAGAATCATVSLTADITGTLAVGNGGIGVATLAANGVLYGNAAGVVLVTAQGPTNSVLVANAGAPSFSATPTVGAMSIVSPAATDAVFSATTPSGANDARLNLTTSGQSGWAIIGTRSDNTLKIGDTTRSNAIQIVAGATGAITLNGGLVGINVSPVADARLQVAGHIHSTGTTPTVGTCGTSPTVTGTDQGGKITTGSSSTTACTLTFGTTWNTAPACTAFGSSAIVTLVATTLNTTTFTLGYAAQANGTILYTCMGIG